MFYIQILQHATQRHMLVHAGMKSVVKQAYMIAAILIIITSMYCLTWAI